MTLHVIYVTQRAVEQSFTQSKWSEVHMRCCTKQQKTKRSGLKVLSRLACKLEFPCVCDLRKHVHNSERKYVADHWCACCRNALSMASVTMNMCASVSVSWGMCLHV